MIEDDAIKSFPELLIMLTICQNRLSHKNQELQDKDVRWLFKLWVAIEVL